MKEKYYTVAKTITKWKIDSPFENWLGEKADNSPIWKRLYVLYYRLFDGKYYKKGLPFIEKEISKQAYGDEIQRMMGNSILRRDIIYSLHRFGTSFEEYFIFKFYDLNTEGRKKFNTLKMQYGYCELVNDPSIRTLFEDKGKCYDLFMHYYRRDLLVVTNKGDANNLALFIKQHPSFIYKPLSGHSGIGITIYRNCDYQNSAFINELMAQGDGKFVVEELIAQAQEMAALHPESINTIRIATFTINESVDILGAVLRVGTGKANVDNAGSGGLYASVDVKDGIVNSIARDNKGHTCLKHPDTGVVFPGFVIPKWDMAIEMVKRMAKTVKGATMVSWDIAYSNKGWIMIEGNDVGEAYLLQAPLQQPIKQIIIEHIDAFIASRQNK